MDFKPIREACRFAVYDEAGLLDCESVTSRELLAMVRPFTDPYTTKSDECAETWLNPLNGRDPAFFPDCPKAECIGQGEPSNEVLRAAVRRGNVQEVRSIIETRAGRGSRPNFRPHVDPNTWDIAGRTPLHDLCDLAGSGRLPAASAVRVAAELLLAHGDPTCQDRAGQDARSALGAAEVRRAQQRGDGLAAA
eukprot:CAMPEP_0179107602 /NCGR_PEP_ID=MMETSP0796-20121207/50087_1 /TAXON_ID=73915 /ORGANISM="Pyrodinium bahamense, Strain pbaha01" /LENGTH=192 /DNA_ID=CAMNT_0020805663 /DNA_START=330 /DNA_END=904 /DNA_ORIENTATION=+